MKQTFGTLSRFTLRVPKKHKNQKRLTQFLNLQQLSQTICLPANKETKLN